MTKIFAIHGAYSTPLMFNYFETVMPKPTWNVLDYHNCVENIRDVCNQADEWFKDSSVKDSHIVGHSLGGLIGLWLAARHPVKSLTTIATPLNGFDLSFAHQLLSPNSFIREISSMGSFIRELHAMDFSNIPIMHIITTKGYNPFLLEPNDGVVTLRSQRAWTPGKVVEVSLNHSECMLSLHVADLISQFIDGEIND